MKTAGFTKNAKEELFHAAHDIKGEAATFGFPNVAVAADSLCRLLEYAPDVTKIPLALVDQHVDAVRAIFREYSRSDAVDLANLLNRRLREVTDEYLVHHNKHRPDVLASIKGPSIVPELIVIEKPSHKRVNARVAVCARSQCEVAAA